MPQTKLAKNMEILSLETQSLPKKRFKVVNEGFTCVHCGTKVKPSTCGTPRNHCPFCLYCLHVDINVGDRENPCRGVMEPVGVVTDSKKEYIIIHKCLKCGAQMRTKIIGSQDIQPDDFDLIIKLSTNQIRISKS
ncbi:MAG: RNHCP domain-containing protein [Pseudomonadota bacterium]